MQGRLDWLLFKPECPLEQVEPGFQTLVMGAVGAGGARSGRERRDDSHRPTRLLAARRLSQVVSERPGHATFATLVREP